MKKINSLHLNSSPLVSKKISPRQSKNTCIFDDFVKDTVMSIETPGILTHEARNYKLKQLISVLHQNSLKPEVQARYQEFRNHFKKVRSTSPLTGENCANPPVQASFDSMEKIKPYPMDQDGYAVSFDPLEEEHAFWETWSRYGFVVGKQVINKELCLSTCDRIREILLQLSNGTCSIDDPATHSFIPSDEGNTPFISRGFFEIYHDDSLAQLRQALRIYLHHVLIWGRADIWTTFDRFGVKLAGHKESTGLPLHVDQNPAVHPHFQTIQGVLALTDCPLERGTYVAVPGSKYVFPEYLHFVKKISQERKEDYRGEYVELQKDSPIAKVLYDRAQPIPLRAGDLVSWDSRTTHANSANLSGEARRVAYISAGPAREQDLKAIQVRREAFETGLGNNVREAYLHASMRPRYTHPARLALLRRPEQLSYLGQLLYSQNRYEL